MKYTTHGKTGLKTRVSFSGNQQLYSGLFYIFFQTRKKRNCHHDNSSFILIQFSLPEGCCEHTPQSLHSQSGSSLRSHLS